MVEKTVSWSISFLPSWLNNFKEIVEIASLCHTCQSMLHEHVVRTKLWKIARLSHLAPMLSRRQDSVGWGLLFPEVWGWMSWLTSHRGWKTDHLSLQSTSFQFTQVWKKTLRSPNLAHLSQPSWVSAKFLQVHLSLSSFNSSLVMGSSSWKDLRNHHPC